MTSRLYSSFCPNGRPFPFVWANAGCAKSATATKPRAKLRKKRHMELPISAPSINLQVAAYRSMIAGNQMVNNVTQGQNGGYSRPNSRGTRGQWRGDPKNRNR